jgi:hypothetical protein
MKQVFTMADTPCQQAVQAKLNILIHKHDDPYDDCMSAHSSHSSAPQRCEGCQVIPRVCISRPPWPCWVTFQLLHLLLLLSQLLPLLISG